MKLTAEQLQLLTEEANAYMAETGKKKYPAAKADELATYGAKRCSKCTYVKLITDFAKNSRNRDGLQTHCKQCHSVNIAYYKKRNTDKVLEYHREYREQHREQINEYARNYHAANRDQRNEYHRTRYHNDEIYKLNHQLRDGYHRAVRSGNTAEWVTAEQLLTYWSARGIDPLRCYLTGTALTPQSRSIDHVVAISNGGSHSVDNLMPCTLTANIKKADLSPEDVKDVINSD